MCDGIKDCENGSDEKECSCSKNDTQCSGFPCIPKNLIKNKQHFCRNDEDKRKYIM